jgi:undecaprenyl-diphosphatase
MTELIQIFIIAVAQGISEFLPISSSGHNVVIEHIYRFLGNPLTENSAEFIKLNAMLHVGSIIAVLLVFRQRIIDMFGKDLRLIFLLVVGTIPAVIVGLLVYMYAKWTQDSLPIISVCFIITGILLLYMLRIPEGEKTCSTMTWKDALIIGCLQAVAILPGLSRSGTTIVVGMMCGLKRAEAAAFSFLLAIPVIAGGGVLHMRDYDSSLAAAQTIPDWLLFVGAAVSCDVGIIALIFLLDWLKKGKLWYFAIWVFLMSPVALLLHFWQP